MKSILCIALTILLTNPAAAQDFWDIPGIIQPPAQSTSLLTKAERGQITLAKCYSDCANRHHESLSILLTLGEASSDRGVCFLVQSHIRTVQACAATCADIERIFGISAAGTRNQFTAVVVPMIEELGSLGGLWNTYTDYPARGTAEFNTACEHFDNESCNSSIEGEGFLCIDS